MKRARDATTSYVEGLSAPVRSFLTGLGARTRQELPAPRRPRAPTPLAARQARPTTLPPAVAGSRRTSARPPRTGKGIPRPAPWGAAPAQPGFRARSTPSSSCVASCAPRASAAHPRTPALEPTAWAPAQAASSRRAPLKVVVVVAAAAASWAWRARGGRRPAPPSSCRPGSAPARRR